MTSYQVTENQALLVSEPPTECRHSNTGKKTQLLKSPFVPKEGQEYAFPTRLGRCQNLGTRRMVCFLQKGRVQSHDFYFCNKAIEVMLKQS